MTTSVQELEPTSCPDRDAFRARIADGCEPVVLRGLCRGWPATRAAAQSWEHLVAYLRQFDSGAVAQAFLGDRSIGGRYHYADDLESFNFGREDLSLADALDRMTAAVGDPRKPSIYMGSLPADDHLPGFAEENSTPILPPSVRPRIWLGTGSSVACHYDSYDNVACVVAGRRRFTLFPPDAVGSLYVGPIDFTMAGQPVALAVGSEPGDPRYPSFESIRDRALVAELHPGDGLFLPKLWWHQVEAQEPVNLLVNYWWDAFSSGPDAPYTTMMLAMIAIAERPAAERRAWRAFFDHYVFRPNGHPLAHLPKEKHGILGPLADGNYRRIRSMVMRLLRGD